MIQNHSQYYEDNNDSIHIHHLATDERYKGIGREIITEIVKYAENNSKKYIRLDNIGSNNRLNKYYEDNGFCALRIIEPEEYDGSNFGILREFKVV